MGRDIAMGLAVTLLVGAGVLMLALAIWKRTDVDGAGPETSAVTPRTERAAPKPKPPRPREPETLREAVTRFRPDMRDTFGRDVDDGGTVALAIWSVRKLHFEDVAVGAAETTHGKIMKDRDAALGKRLCVRGIVIEIYADVMIGVRVFTGRMLGAGTLDHVWSFVAVGDTGDLVAESPARFCGVVTGLHIYESVRKVEIRAPKLVGMFDLPANR